MKKNYKTSLKKWKQNSRICDKINTFHEKITKIMQDVVGGSCHFE